MDKGAHFHKADFQVHTPRDPGWTGAKPVSNSERDILYSQNCSPYPSNTNKLPMR